MREGTIVPDITLMGETVTNKSELTLLGILDNRVHDDFLGDLFLKKNNQYTEHALQLICFRFFFFYLELSVGPTGNLNNHVKNGLLSVSKERDIMEGRNGNTVLLCFRLNSVKTHFLYQF